ncbi:MAG: nucleotidyltransferase domain-containing protein [Nannocystaceae bacterium]
MTAEPTPALDQLERDLVARGQGIRWDGLRAARAQTETILGQLREALADLHDPNCTVLVTGSLGRGEASRDSDADWVLVVDGPSDTAHAQLGREIGERIRQVVPKDPGPTGTFGDMVVSHDLVHNIAGTRDSNINLTRRMLMLAESRAVSNPLVRERVIRNVLARYVLHDRAVRSSKTRGRFNKIPYFLLNEVVRYWRTVATDYASKKWERDGRGWATRNIKLRFSRKLVFTWGLIAALSAELFETPSLEGATDEEEHLILLSEIIREQTDVSPLELLARVVRHPEVQPETAVRIFGAYDQFIAALSDPGCRRRLESVHFDEAADDETYESLRKASYEFRVGINALFFDEHPVLRELIRKFGVF